MAVTIGQIIGSGILRSPSVIASEVPGIGLIIGLWVLGAIQVSLAANLYAELGTAMPRTGGEYNYVRRAMGDVFGLVEGWTAWLSNAAGAAAASVSFAEFLPLLVPAAGAHKIAAALSLQVALYVANISGLREGRAVQELTSFVKAAMLFVFIFVAVLFVSPAEPRNMLSSPVVFAWANVIVAYQLIMGAYAGWQTPLAFAGENADPGRAIPRAMFGGIALTAVLFIGVNWALLHALSPAGVAASPLPFSAVLSHFAGNIPATLFALTALVTVASCSNACIMTAPRVLFALGSDHLLPRVFTRVNAGGSPVTCYLMTALFTLGLAATGAFALVFGLIGTLNAAGESPGGYLILGSAGEGAANVPPVPRGRLSGIARHSASRGRSADSAVHDRRLHRRNRRGRSRAPLHSVCDDCPSRAQKRSGVVDGLTLPLSLNFLWYPRNGLAFRSFRHSVFP